MMHRVAGQLAVIGIIIGSSVASAENWPQFRGPTRQGIASESNLPTEWSSTENIAWRTPLEGQGWSSPIVHGDNIFVTATTDGGKACFVQCIDRPTGMLRWNREVFTQETRKAHERNSAATPTPVTDGKRVVAVFYDGSVVALDVDGNVLWSDRNQDFYSQHGLGASPTMYDGMVIMPFDGSHRPPQDKVGWQIPWDKSYILAFDIGTGKVRWRASRGLSRIGHVSPIVISVDGKDVLVSLAGDVVQGFDPASGERLWSVRSEGEGIVPTAVFGDGLVFGSSGFGKPTLRAVRPASGSNAAEIVWEQPRGVTMIPSPLFHEGRLFTVSEKGVAQCLDAATGNVLWQQRLDGAYAASPILASGKIYALSEEGVTTVFEAADAFRIVSKNPIGENCKASLAASQGNLFLRSAKALYRVGPKGSPASE